MSDNTNTTANESQAEPTFYELVMLSGLAPEVFMKLDEVRKAEWVRVWHARKAKGADANG